MAFTKQVTFKGAVIPNAHLEIVSVSIYRQTGKIHVYYRVYADRQSCVEEPEKNIITENELLLPFSGMGSALSAFYAALEAKLLVKYPGAVAASDAISF